MQREYVPAGTEIVREGEFGSRFYIVLGGLLSVTQDARGERALLRPGDYFGEVAPAMGIRRTASVRAVTPGHGGELRPRRRSTSSSNRSSPASPCSNSSRPSGARIRTACASG